MTETTPGEARVGGETKEEKHQTALHHTGSQLNLGKSGKEWDGSIVRSQGHDHDGDEDRTRSQRLGTKSGPAA